MYRKNILVTGAHGFIGRHVSALFELHGWQVTKAVRKPSSPTEVLFDLENSDVSSLNSLTDIDAIIHLAAKVDMKSSEFSSLNVANVLATRKLTRLAKERNAFFLFSSTALINSNDFSGDKTTPLPVSYAYVRSKLLAEYEVSSLNDDAAIFRICGVYGSQGPEHLGINKAIHALTNGEVPQQVATGRAKRNYLYVKDLAQMIYTATLHRVTGVHSVASTEVLTISEMLNILCDRFSPQRKVEILQGEEAQDQIVVPSPLFPSKYSFKEAVDDIHAEMIT